MGGKGRCLWKRKDKENSAKIKIKVGVFRSAPWLRSGLNMPGFIERMSLVMTEERGTFVEDEKGKNPVQYDL